MSAPIPLPPLDAPPPPVTRRRSAAVAPPPDRRELLGLAALAGVVALAHVASLGTVLIGPLVETPAVAAAAGEARASAAAISDGLLVVVARTLPWLLGIVGLGALFALRWMPRAHQRLVEPSLIAGWVAFVSGAAAAWALGLLDVWPWTWTTTAPETATLLARFVATEQALPAALLLVVLCLVVPLLSELVFRHALLEGLRARGYAAWQAVGMSALAFGVWWLVAGWSASPTAALQQAGVASLAGVALGAVAVRAPRGRGLGLCVLAHMAWMSADTYALLRTLPLS